jgi:glutathione S-transferase
MILRHMADHRESSLILYYIDDAFPEPPLMPREPRQRHRVRFGLSAAPLLFHAVDGDDYGPRHY